MKRLLREPLLHFLALGLVLVGVRAAVVPDAAGSLGTIRVSEAQLAELHTRWRNETGRAPDAAERRALVRDYVDAQLLFREALRRDLDRGDPVVRQRLIRNMRFADPGAHLSDEALAARARALDMIESDPVIRRRLIQVMRHRIQSRVRVSRSQVQLYMASNRGKHALAARYCFRQVFFNGDRRVGPRQAASEALARLRAAEGGKADALGDPFQLGRRFRNLSPADIERRFGARFAERVEQAPVGSWIGPVASGYGAHLIRVVSRTPARAAEPARLRSHAVAEVRAERERARLQTELQRLRDRYRIRVRAGYAAREPGA